MVGREGKDRLRIHRFSQTGNLVDALQVNLPEISKFFPESWPEFWEVLIDEKTLTIVLGAWSGGVLSIYP